MPAFNGSGALKKKGKRSRIQKERELDKNFRVGTLKSINGGKSAMVVLNDTGETIDCHMPRGIRVKYRIKDEVKVNIYNELIGKFFSEKENIDCEQGIDEDEHTVDMKQYSKEIKKESSVLKRNRNRGESKETRQENDFSESETESESSEEDNSDSIDKNEDDASFFE
jgi:hypothetical protein